VSYLAEGATGTFFDTRIAIANPTASPAHVLSRFQTDGGRVFSDYRTLPPHSRATIDADTWPFLAEASFSSVVEADADVVVDRTMTWGAGGYGSHAERGWRGAPATAWYFAEGATHGGFDLFYLLQNPGATAAQIEVTYLLPAPRQPVVRQYTMAPSSRLTIRVDDVPGLAETDTSAIVRSTNGVPILAERSMYFSRPDSVYAAGHANAGVDAPAPRWFLAEGATGPFFNMYILVANPGTVPAIVRFDYLLTDGRVITRERTVAPISRMTLDAAFEAPELATAAFSTILTSTNDVPIVVERSMWWPAGGSGWQEAHDSTGAVASATRWACAEGESGGASQVQTYLLIANTSSLAGSARVTLLFEDGSTAERTFTLRATSRLNVNVGVEFPSTDGRRYGALIESLGATPAAIVVARAMYAKAGGIVWAAGTDALATPLP
jgi:hypothetical protein